MCTDMHNTACMSTHICTDGCKPVDMHIDMCEHMCGHQPRSRSPVMNFIRLPPTAWHFLDGEVGASHADSATVPYIVSSVCA